MLEQVSTDFFLNVDFYLFLEIRQDIQRPPIENIHTGSQIHLPKNRIHIYSGKAQ
jgi:hypothetical protein